MPYPIVSDLELLSAMEKAGFDIHIKPLARLEKSSISFHIRHFLGPNTYRIHIIQQDAIFKREIQYRQTHHFANDQSLTIGLPGFEQAIIEFTSFGVLRLDNFHYNGDLSFNVPSQLVLNNVQTQFNDTPQSGNVWVKRATKVITEGQCIVGDVKSNARWLNRGEIYADTASIEVKAPARHEGVTLDNSEGKLIVREHFALKGTSLKNTRGTIEAASLNFALQGKVINSGGHIIASSGNVYIKSLAKNNRLISVSTRNGGSIQAEVGRVVIEAKNIVTDDTSLVRGKEGTHLSGAYVHQETCLTGSEVSLKGSTAIDVNAGILAEKILSVKQARNKFTVKQPMISNGQVKLSSPTLAIRAPILAGKFSKNKDAYPNANIEIQASQNITIGSKDKLVDIHASGITEIAAKDFELIHGRVIGAKGLQIKSEAKLIAGRDPQAKLKPSLLASNADIKLSSATANIVLQDIRAYAGRHAIFESPIMVDNIASNLMIMGDALFDTPLNQHRLLFEYQSCNQSLPYSNMDSFSASKTLHGMQKATTNPAEVLIQGKCETTGKTLIFAGDVSCANFLGEIPVVQNFIPCGNATTVAWFGRVNKPWSRTWNENVVGTPMQGKLSIREGVQSLTPVVNVAGILASRFIHLRGILQGMVGVNSNMTIKLPPLKAFRSFIPLIDYIKPNPLYDISPKGYPSVFKPLLPFNFSNSQGPILILHSDGRLRPNIHHRRCLLSVMQEAEIVLQGLMGELGRGFLEGEGDNYIDLLTSLRKNTEIFVRGLPDATPLGQSPRPMLVYKEQPFAHRSGLEEIVLVPHLYLPPTLDNPKMRDWAGGLFSLNEISLQGISNGPSQFCLTGHMDAKKKIEATDFQTFSVQKRVSVENITVYDENIQSSLCGLKKKKKSIARQMEIIKPEPGVSISGSELHLKNIDHFLMSGLTVNAGEGGIIGENVKVIEQRALTETYVQPTWERQKGLLGGSKSLTHEQELNLHPSVFNSLGPVKLHSEVGYYDNLIVNTPSTRQITANQMIIGAYPKKIVEQKRAQAAAKAEAKRTAKRKQNQAFIKSGVCIAITAGFTLTAAPVLFAGSSTFVATVGSGAICGGLSALVHETNPLRGMVEGGIFAGFAHLAGEALSQVKSLKDAEQLREALIIAGSAGLSTTLHGGNLFDNILISVGANAVGNFIAPGTKIAPDANLTALQITQQIQRAAIKAGVTAGVTAVAKGGDLRASITSACLGGTQAMAQGYSHVYAEPRRIAAESRLAQMKAKKQEIAYKQQFTIALKDPSVRASKLLSDRGTHLGTYEIENAVFEHPAMQGSVQQVKTNLVKLGSQGTSNIHSADALNRGLEYVLMATLNTLVGEAQAAQNPSHETAMRTYNPDYKKLIGWQAALGNQSTDRSSFDFLVENQQVIQNKREAQRRHLIQLNNLLTDPNLERGIGQSMLIATGRSAVKVGQGINQFGLEVAEKCGWVSTDALKRYTDAINEETRWYERTPVANSFVGKSTEFSADLSLMLGVPGGSGLKGAKLIFSGGAMGALWGGIQATTDGQLVTRLENMVLGAAAGAVGTYAVDKAARGIFKLYGFHKLAAPKSFARTALSRARINNAENEADVLRAWNSYRNNPLPNSAADGIRLRNQLLLSEQSAASTLDGLLPKDVIRNSFRIPIELRLKDTPLGKELSKRAGNIYDWGKYQTQPIHTSTGLARVHFYYNPVTNDIYYGRAYKSILDHQGAWKPNIDPKVSYEPIKFD